MFRTPGLPTAAGRHVCIALGLVAGVLSASSLQAQQPAAPAAAAQAAPTTRVFSGDAGMVLNFIKADKVADFEIFKAAEPGAGGSVLYVFIVDPSVKGADYSVANILAESFPPEQVNEIYKAYAGAYATGQNIVNLSLVSDLGK
jgi:hypothetical protein